ncbi:MAG TPA: 5'-nucleotidase C-terminal domain-containing protein [Thermoanaerobaculia bacterium]|nr:5'-nucleotidase C-terminal domain-containing protein [Thermoanaerobaculia bacterium]
MKRTLLLGTLLLAACSTINPPLEPVHVVLVGTTDVHGWYAGHVETPEGGGEPVRYGGVATLAAYVDALRAATGDNVIVVDSGDMFQGTLESNLFEGEPVVRAYNAIGYSAAAIGNHEFDYGPAGARTIASDPGDDPLGALKKISDLATFPLLSANMTERSTGQTPVWAKKWTMVEVDGARIGIIGLSTPDTPNVTIALNVRTLAFGDPVAATVEAAREARADGADAIVVIAHMGGRCGDISDPADPSSCEPQQEVMEYMGRLPAGTIDAYFAGHTHSRMGHFINGVPVVQAWPFSSDFSRVDLWVDTRANRVQSERTVIMPPTMICAEVYSGTDRCDPRRPPADATLVPREFEGKTITPDLIVARAVEPFLERTAAMRSEPLGVTAAETITRNYRSESALGNLFTDTMREAFGTDFSVMNSGGIRANLRAGDLVYADIFQVSPFDNYPTVVTMTGAQIREMLRVFAGSGRGVMQVSGLRYTFDAAMHQEKPPAQRDNLISVTTDQGLPLDPARTYTVVMPDFLAYGGDGLESVMTAVPAERKRFHQEQPMRDVFAAVLKKRAVPVTPRLEGRITILNERPATGD